MTKGNGGEKLWKWVMRACAVGGFVYLLVTSGIDAPTTFYVLLIGLFFGPEIITGQLKFFVQKDEDDK